MDYLRAGCQKLGQSLQVRFTPRESGDISEAVSRLKKLKMQLKSAIDLLWINGENFS